MGDVSGGELLVRSLHAEGVRDVWAIPDGTYITRRAEGGGERPRDLPLPGFVDTPLPRRRLSDMPPDQRARWGEALELIPMIAASEVAEGVLELVGDGSLAGAVMVVLHGGGRKLAPAPSFT